MFIKNILSATAESLSVVADKLKNYNRGGNKSYSLKIIKIKKNGYKLK